MIKSFLLSTSLAVIASVFIFGASPVCAWDGDDVTSHRRGGGTDGGDYDRRPNRHGDDSYNRHGGDRDDYDRRPSRTHYPPIVIYPGRERYPDRDRYQRDSDHDGIPDRYDRTPYGERERYPDRDRYPDTGRRPPRDTGERYPDQERHPGNTRPLPRHPDDNKSSDGKPWPPEKTGDNRPPSSGQSTDGKPWPPEKGKDPFCEGGYGKGTPEHPCP